MVFVHKLARLFGGIETTNINLKQLYQMKMGYKSLKIESIVHNNTNLSYRNQTTCLSHEDGTAYVRNRENFINQVS